MSYPLVMRRTNSKLFRHGTLKKHSPGLVKKLKEKFPNEKLSVLIRAGLMLLADDGGVSGNYIDRARNPRC